jgi:hypothetical protein
MTLQIKISTLIMLCADVKCCGLVLWAVVLLASSLACEAAD